MAPSDADIVMNGQTFDDSIFPEGFVSLVSWQYTYLLNLPGEPCVLSSTISAEAGRLYDESILCKVPLRSLKVWSRGLDPWTAPNLRVEFWYMRGGGVDSQVTTPDSTQVIGFHQIGSDSPKQGFSFPVIPGTEHSYRLSLTTGDGQIPTDFIVEFSDTVIGNRYSEEYTYLSLNGRRCGSNGLVSSQHDRRFIWSGGEFLKDEAWGKGACSLHGTSDVPIIDCSSIKNGVLHAEECPEQCNFGCASNSFCDCGSSTCKPRQGFVEETAIDLCDAARCEHGHCTATFLGGSIPVNLNACVCDEGYSGPLCQYNPCDTLGKTCSGHGTCVALSDASADCQCDQGFSGDNCEVSCDEVCSGEWPYGCAEDLGDDIVKYGCHAGAGCFYLRENEEYPSDDVCTYKEANQKGCICDDQNDCLLTLPCNSDGSCPTSEYVPDDTPCNSVPFGQCKSGMCQEPTNPPPSPRSTPTHQVSKRCSTLFVFATKKYSSHLKLLRLFNNFISQLFSSQRLNPHNFPPDNLQSLLPLSLLLNRLTVAALSVLKQSGMLLPVMKVWVAVTLVGIEFCTSRLSMEVLPITLAIPWPVSFRTVHATSAILIRAMMLQQSPQRVHHRLLHLNHLSCRHPHQRQPPPPPMSRLKSLLPILNQLIAAALSVLKQSGTLLLVMIAWVAAILAVVG